MADDKKSARRGAAKAAASMAMLKELNLPEGEPIYRNKAKLMEALAQGNEKGDPEVVDGKVMPSYSSSLYSQVQPLPIPTPMAELPPPPARENGDKSGFQLMHDMGVVPGFMQSVGGDVRDMLKGVGREMTGNQIRDNKADRIHAVEVNTQNAKDAPFHRAMMEHEMALSRRRALGLPAGPADVPPVDPGLFGLK